MRKGLKFKLSILFILFFTSCSLVFQNDSRPFHQAEKMSLENGGTLSSDTANDITPFVFRYNGQAWLFFSSDRGGTYDIWYSEMFLDGKFSDPQKVPNINTISNEFSPVVFFTNNNIYLTLIRASNSFSNIVTYTNGGNGFNFIAVPLESVSVSYTRIGFFSPPTGAFQLIGTTGTKNMDKRTFLSFSTPWNTTPSLSTLSNSVDSAQEIVNPSDGLTDYVYSITGSKDQLGGGIQNGFNISPPGIIPDYSSSFNDRDAFVDTDFKVYFASDEFSGGANFDLYRYNLTTFDKAVYSMDKTPPVITSVLNSLGAPINGTTNSGATIGVAGLNVNAHDSGVGIRAVYYRVNGGSWVQIFNPISSYTNSSPITINDNVSSPIANMIEIRAVDFFGNEAVVSLIVYGG